LQKLDQRRRCAREIFDHALASVDPRTAVREAIAVDGPMVEVCAERFGTSSTPLFAIAIGKAAGSMAFGLEDAIGEKLSRGVITAPPLISVLSARWEIFAGGHPLPNEASLAAAQAAFTLLDEANEARGIVIFLVSGGGSAMMEWPIDPEISLDDLRRTNERLVRSGASINEINAVRRSFSAVKGGGLARRAPNARLVTLIVSDTNPGDEASVASGPTFSVDKIEAPYYVLLDNSTALEAAHQKAIELGFTSTITHDIREQPIQEGVDLLLARQTAECVISGGEFSCPVRGDGRGGRNLETMLRLALAETDVVAMSAGTDGIDGNSPAAGAMADESTITRARNLGLDAREFLEHSDSYTFFEALGDLIITGSTGTNVRDLRIVIR
jgi:glycerate 2-kinase